MKNFFLLLITFFIVFSCKKEKTEWEIEREEKYKIDSLFNVNIPKKEIINIFDEINLAQIDTTSFVINGKLCAIQIVENSPNDFLFLDDDLNTELIRNGYNVATKFKDVNYFFLTKYDLDTIGSYINEDGKKQIEATVIINSLYIYDSKMKKISFLTKHRGSNPKQTIDEKHKFLSSSGSSWRGENYLKFLEENNYLKKQ